jgi:tetratricopeptide (TPR) repeat protein
MNLRKVLAVALVGLSCCVIQGANQPAFAQDDHAGHAAGGTFGTVDFDISCSDTARTQFNRGVSMLHSFFYPETEKAFRAVIEREPSCAMAYWGLAISQRPNPLTAPFPPALLKQGWEAIEQARLAKTATAREHQWIEALASFFEGYDRTPQNERTAKYEAAMADLHLRYPDDREAAVFYALALLEAVDLTDKTYARQLKAAGILEAIERQLPDHPGAVHYIIHAYDYAPIAARGLPAARRYATLAPSAPHALHMPSHIFSTLGMWQDAITSNLAADQAVRDYAIGNDPKIAANPGAIVGRYHPLDFLVNAYLQLAQDQKAADIVGLRNSPGATPSGGSVTAHTGFAAIPVRYVLERHAWAEAAALEPFLTPFKQAEAIVYFARVMGKARIGDVGAADQDLATIGRLRQELSAAGDPYWAEQVAILEVAASAWVQLARQDTPRAMALMREAADREDASEKHIAMENRLSPMRELLGELLLEARRPAEAFGEFERSLDVVPGRFRSLAGAARAAEDMGNREAATTYYRRLLELASEGDGARPALAAARAYLTQGKP